MDAETQSTELFVRVLEWLHARRKMIIAATVVVVLIGVIIAFMSWKKSQDEANANEDLLNVPLQLVRPAPISPKSLLDIANNYPSTPSGEYGRLLGATALFTQAKYPEAYKEFTDFLNTYPDSPLAPQAKVGVAASLEAQGKITEAENKYHDIILTSSEPNIVSPAKLTLARLYEENGQPQQAFNYYVELARGAAQNQGDPWAVEAQERARLLVSKHPEVAKALQDAAAKAAQSPAAGFTLGTPTQPGPSGTTAAPAPSPARPSNAPGSAPGGQAPTLMNIPSASNTNATKPK